MIKLTKLCNKRRIEDERTPPESRHATALRGARSRFGRALFTSTQYIETFRYNKEYELIFGREVVF